MNEQYQPDLEESVKVSVEVDEPADNRKIKEKTYELFTGNNKEIDFVTERINGMLESVVLTTSKPVQVEILMDMIITEFVIYENNDFKGSMYLPLRAMAVPRRGGEQFNFSPVRLALNDFLRVRVKGVENTDISLIVRYS